MDTSVPNADESIFNLDANYRDFCGDVVEEEHHLLPEPLQRPVDVGYFVDVKHGGNLITRLSHSRILLFVNNALTKYFSNLKNTVKSSMFDSELVSLRIARDMIV